MMYTMITMVDIYGALLSVFQFLFVLFLICTNQWRSALLAHFVFWTCSLSVANASAMFGGNHDLTMYNYCRLELYGPLKFSYIVSLLLWLKAIVIHKDINKKSLFYHLYKIMLFLMLSGILLGLFGFLFDSNYSLEGGITYGMYITLTVMSLYTLLKFDCLCLRKSFYDWSKAVLIGSVYAVAVCFFLGFRSAYSTQTTILSNDMWYYAPILLPGFFVIRERLYCIIAIILLIPLSLFSSGGKTLIILGVALLFFGYNCFFIDKTIPLKEQKVRKRLRIFFVIGIVFLLYFGILTKISVGELTQNKLQDVESLFTFDLNRIDRSPAIRIATFLNILYNNRFNPIAVIFGNGYGGYFTDELGLFIGLDVWNGGWPEEMCNRGIYTSGHDTFAAVPLVNGLFGLYLILKITFKYLRLFRKSFLVLAVVPWLLLTFYANINYVYIAIFLLYAANYYLEDRK